MASLGHICLERDFFVVVNSFDLNGSVYVDACLFEFPLLLQLGKSACFFELFLTHFARCFLTLRVCEAGSALLEHLFLILVHVDRVRTRRLGLRVRINLTSQTVSGVIWIVGISALSDVKKLLVLFNALLRCAANKLGDCAPHCGENLRQVQQHFLFLARPLCFLDGWVEPLIPASLALLGTLAHEKGRNSAPLVQTVLHHGRLKDLVLGIFPNSALNHVPHRSVCFLLQIIYYIFSAKR